MTDERLEAAFRRIDEANAEDPNLERLDGEDHPKELLYGRRMSATLAINQAQPCSLTSN